MVTHTFLPNFIGGREKHTFCLAKNLNEIGLEADILTGDNVKGKNKEYMENVLVERLITNNKTVPIYFKRVIDLYDDPIITDTIQIHNNSLFSSLSSGKGFATIMVPSSRYYQESVLDEWVNLNSILPELNQKKQITIQRNIENLSLKIVSCTNEN